MSLKMKLKVKRSFGQFWATITCFNLFTHLNLGWNRISLWW